MKHKIVCAHPCLTMAFYSGLLLLDAQGYMTAALAAALWHELGHVLYWIWWTHTFPLISVSPFGLTMQVTPEALPSWHVLWLALAGPFFNVLLAGLLFIWSGGGYFQKAVFIAANLLTALWNLAPIPPLDGYRAICAIVDLLRR